MTFQPISEADAQFVLGCLCVTFAALALATIVGPLTVLLYRVLHRKPKVPKWHEVEPTRNRSDDTPSPDWESDNVVGR